MASGGYRPGAGRPPGVKETKSRKKKTSSKTKKPAKARKPAKKPEENPVVPTEKDKIIEMLSFSTRAKAKLYQEYLIKVNRGENLSLGEKKMMDKLGDELAEQVMDTPSKAIAKAENLKPLEYMLKVMNDPNEEKDRRDRMAIAACPYLHPRAVEMGKKETAEERAKAASLGRFASGRPPLTIAKKEK